MIYCVEDDASIRELVLYTLRASGFEARGFAESGAFWEAMCEHVPDLVLLDIMLPGEDGLETLKKLRSSPLTEQLPVILATARGSEYDKVVGLDTGADDYLAKPFGMMEMVSRIRAVLRRNQMVAESGEAADDDIPLVCGDISMRIGQHEVTVRGENVFFPLKEFELLEYLMQNKGRVMTRHQLIDRIWGSDYVGDTKTLDVHVKRVRAKIEEDPGHPKYLTTVRGLGYKIDTPSE